MKLKKYALITVFFILNVNLYSSTLENELKKAIIGKWTLYKVKAENEYKHAPDDFYYKIIFYRNGSVKIIEKEKSFGKLKKRLNLRSKDKIERGIYKIEGKYLILKVYNVPEKIYRIFSLSKRRLILRVKGNEVMKYLYYFFKKN